MLALFFSFYINFIWIRALFLLMLFTNISPYLVFSFFFSHFAYHIASSWMYPTSAFPFPPIPLFLCIIFSRSRHIFRNAPVSLLSHISAAMTFFHFFCHFLLSFLFFIFRFTFLSLPFFLKFLLVISNASITYACFHLMEQFYFNCAIQPTAAVLATYTD